MSKRATTEDIAGAIINANEILSMGLASPAPRPDDPI